VGIQYLDAEGVTIVSPDRNIVMTSTTSLKLPEELKAIIAETAKRRGKTAHALMVEALQQAMEEAQVEDEFHREAMQAYEDTAATNICYSHEEISNWMLAKLRGENPPKPKPQPYNPAKPMRPENGRMRKQQSELH
jgi:predicted transcriptional regulator